ncbi:MAG: ATP-dependent DNA helicase [Flavobacteriales bacterium BRH_c54]|nr:MAG: ATP-dependent DNA helicase [Flavobacteriales bacterium BRH_c54]
MNYLNELNPAQQDAVTNTEGPVMVIAGAGSGKTRVLTYRIAHLINKGVDPFNILSLTFTNKAAQEMKERIGKIIGYNEARNIWMGTFHSVFARILRTESEKIGYPSNFTIYDTQDAKNLIKTILKEKGLDDKVYKPNLVLNRISSAKNNLISATRYVNDVTLQSEDRQAAKPRVGEIYQTYETRCFQASAMDFDDLLFKTNILFKDFPDVLHKYQHRFKYILVDEYQDTNFSQYIIVKKLAAVFQNICVVGDDAQSIYAFRGANIENILNFKNDYPELKTFKLEENYRSTKTIVGAANNIIKNNKHQLEKNVFTSNELGNNIKVYAAATENEEGKIIANAIFDIQQQEKAKNKDFAVLYRTNNQSRSIEESLRRKNIPYKIYGGLSFYQRKEVKDMLAYFRLIVNPNDEESLKRVINYPARGIGNTTLDKISITAVNQQKPIWEIITNINYYPVDINNGTKNKLAQFVEMIKSFQIQLQTKNAYDVGHEVASTSGILKELFSDRTPEGISKYENIQELLNGLKEFSENENELEEDVTPRGLPEFLQDVALLTNADNEKDEDKNKVTLMTIHASKGLEFPHVFIVGLEENLFPSQLSLTSRADLEEERRLFYVAVTRAEKSLTLSYAVSRYKFGTAQFNEPSRFLSEIDDDFLDFQTPKSIPSSQPTSFDFERNSYSSNYQNKSNYKSSNQQQIKQHTPPPLPKNLKKIPLNQQVVTSSAESLDLKEGTMVNHERFGNGIITNLENGKATVNFQQSGTKQLLLKFAKLTVIN